MVSFFPSVHNPTQPMDMILTFFFPRMNRRKGDFKFVYKYLEDDL